MKVLILDTKAVRNATIWGIDGNDHTKEWFDKFLSDTDEIRPTTAEEKHEYGNDVEYAFDTDSNYTVFQSMRPQIQSAYDAIYKAVGNGEKAEYYIGTDTDAPII